jgi:hypothetical protein
MLPRICLINVQRSKTDKFGYPREDISLKDSVRRLGLLSAGMCSPCLTMWRVSGLTGYQNDIYRSIAVTMVFAL